MIYPFKNKIVTLNNSVTNTLKDYQEISEIPVGSHPGAFAVVRKNHIHEGVDLYCQENEEVFSMEKGVIVYIGMFTGKEVNSAWWNTTWCVMVEGLSGVFNYGEIIPNNTLYIGQEIEEGTLLGKVTPVLKKDKGRPLNMLHLELYIHNTKKHIDGWALNTPQPQCLLNPTEILINCSSPVNHIKNSKKI